MGRRKPTSSSGKSSCHWGGGVLSDGAVGVFRILPWMPSRISQGSFSCPLWVKAGRETAQGSWEVAFLQRALQWATTGPAEQVAGCPHPRARTWPSAQSVGSVLSNQPVDCFPGLGLGEAWLLGDSRLCSKQTPCQGSGLGDGPPWLQGWSVVVEGGPRPHSYPVFFQ